MNVVNAILAATFELLDAVLGFYLWAVILSALLSWLMFFGIVNGQSRFIHVIGDFLYRITEPVLKRIRRFLPSLGNIDLAPLVLLFAIWFLQSFLRHLAASGL